MSRRNLLRCSLPVLLAALLAAPPRARAQVQVVNMIPASMSDESRHNQEPYVAVNPANPLLIAATAFMPTPAGSPNGPMLVSLDGGLTWAASNIIPSSPGSFYNTGDVTIRFNTAGTALYAGILGTGGGGGLQIIRTTDMTLGTPMTLISIPRATDQPYIAARTVTGWFDPGKDRVWVGNNEGAANPASATVDLGLDAGIASPTFSQIRIDVGTPVGRDNYQVRTVAHPDGHIYAAFYRRRGSIAGGYNADVVVVREDDWGKTMPPFRNLVDTTTMVAGQNVVASTQVSDTSGSDATLGNDWWGGDLFLTVDPNNSARVYISYSDSVTGSPRTIHLRRSNDSGQTWGPDLLTVQSAKNAAIAVNSQGRIAYLYQSLTGTSPNKRWQTHLRRSADGTSWDDVILADHPAEGAGGPSGMRVIGDYENMIAVGKNFYGVFSAYNDLATASFPAGVNWLRNKTAPGVTPARFLGVDGTTTVAPSVDPFFFRTTEIEPGADFYVRDWTDSSATHDRGQEPSVRSNFYSTSDVWNRRTNDPQPFDANDRPQVQDPQPSAMGHNFAFARVSREAAGAAADVTLSYLYSDGGVGVNYVSAGAPATLHFAAADLQKTPASGQGLQWDLPSGASNHACLAVEISAPGDPVISPTLLGHAPGWPTTDLMVVNDNNKAQRNMQVFGFGGMSAGAAQSAVMSMYARVHNAATFTRDITLGVNADRRDLAQLRGATLRVVGRQDAKPEPVRPGAVLTLPKMLPGENRWIELSFSPAQGARAAAPVEILELVGGTPVNGYSLIPTPMSTRDAIRDALAQHAAVFARLAKTFSVSEAAAQSKRADELLAKGRIDPADYVRFLREQAEPAAELIRSFLGGGEDPFGVADAAKRLASPPADPAVAQVLHLTLLNKLDAEQSRRYVAGGDVADVAQNVRWQRDLFGRLKGLKGSREVVARSSEFLSRFERRQIGVDDFMPLAASLMGAYREAASKHKGSALDRLLEAVAAAKSPAELQNAHREFLLALDAASPR
jgi:hypothetical protein